LETNKKGGEGKELSQGKGNAGLKGSLVWEMEGGDGVRKGLNQVTRVSQRKNLRGDTGSTRSGGARDRDSAAETEGRRKFKVSLHSSKSGSGATVVTGGSSIKLGM